MTEMDFEAQVRAIASRTEYPRTPDIAGSVTARLRSSTHPRFISKAAAWSLTVVLILISSLMLIPPARAAILEFIQVGVVRIFRTGATPEAPSITVPITATPAITPQPWIPILEALAGDMTLEEAQEKVDYQILLPSYPSDLGEPDRIFVQDAQGAMTILVWLDPQEPDQIQMSLHFLPPESWAIKKVEPTVIEETSVNGQYAVWTTGPYPLRLENGNIEFLRMIEGHVLIWKNGTITYRLETALPLEEAIKIAESLQPVP
jgi:hypothetical protein